MRNCRVVGRVGYENIPFIKGTHVAAAELEDVSFENLSAPVILCEPDAKVSIKN